MNIKVLLVEPDAADALFVQDVLLEIGAGDFWLDWVSFETIHAATWEEAVSVLSNGAGAEDAIDIILLAADLPGGAPLVRLRALQELAAGIPIVLLTASDDRGEAGRLLREGAQDVIVKSDLDCIPLARAMRHAVERQRYIAAVRAASMLDSLTGLVNREAFLMLARRDLGHCERLGQHALFLNADLEALRNVPTGDRADLSIIEASDFLRSLIGPNDLLGRTSAISFGISILNSQADALERSWGRIAALAAERGIIVGGAIFNHRRPVSIERLMEEAAATALEVARQ